MSFVPPEKPALVAELQAEIKDLRAQLATSQAAQNDLQSQLLAIQHDPLGDREQRALLLISQMQQSVLLLDMQGTILETNQAGLDPAVLQRQRYVGRPLWDPMLFSGSRVVHDQVRTLFQQAVATGRSVRQELEFPMPGNAAEMMVVDGSFTPVYDSQGSCTFVLFEGRDITQRKRAEEEVARKNIELQELYERVHRLDQLKSTFFAMMNHELRTPLTLILGPTEALLRQPSLTQEVRQMLEVVSRNGRLLLKLVNDLFEISRLEQGKLELHYAACDLSRVVRLLATNFALVAEERHIRYEVQVPEQLWVEIDPARIERVLLNLLSNAFKFTPDGGQITCILQMAFSSQVVLIVQDSGPGVPVQLRELIFERFRQTEEGARSSFGGTGLGLAIARDLITLHGGTIQVDEAPGGGARFTISLPQSAPPGTLVRSEEEPAFVGSDDMWMSQTAVEELLPAQPISLSASIDTVDEEERSLVLIVEDHVQMREFLVAQLRSRYRIAEATNGHEGLTLAQQLHPDLILTDLMMPAMSGEEMVSALRADHRYDDIPIVILSARGNDELRVHLLRKGVQDYLVKPFSSEELHARLGNLLVMQRTRRLLQQEVTSSQQDLELLVRSLATTKHELEHTNSQLLHINKQQANFIAVISHEFRTALSGIQGFSELLSEQECSPQEVKEYASDILTDAKRLKRLIDTILDFERANSGNMKLHTERIQINTLLQRLGKQTQQITAIHTIVYRLDDMLPEIEADPDLLTQVITNLLSNAMKYAPNGGAIMLCSQRDPQGIRFSIQDQGMGIPEAAQQEIFAPYSRIHGEHTRYIQGTGLGLSIVQEIIRLHGGTIWVESVLGRGSTFHIILPLVAQS